MTETTLHTDSTIGGVRPAQQERSRKRRDDLLDAGLSLLRNKSLEDLTILEIARACDSSVGAFYSRFTNKEGFFNALQDREIERSRARIRDALADEIMLPLAARERLQVFVDTVVSEVRNMEGILFASLKHESTQPDTWTPHRASGRTLTEMAVKWLSSSVPGEDADNRVRFATQTILGVLVNAVLHRPGPVHIEDPAFSTELGEMAARYLSINA